MSSRHGVTLMEVLVAMFVMGIGMLAMLVLFPLGALRMALAIQHARCGEACRQGTAIGEFQQVRNDPWVLYDQSANWTANIPVLITNPGSGYTVAPTVVFSPPQQAGGTQATGLAAVNAGAVISITVTNAGTGYTQLPLITIAPSPTAGGIQATALVADPFTMPASNWLPADPAGPSYPVFVDPMGYCSSLGLPNQFWLAGNYASNTIIRRTAQYTVSALGAAPNSALALRWNCLLDDLPFANDSTLQYDAAPNPPNTPGAFTRDIRFSWAYMLRRPRTSDRSIVEMSVVVYSSRAILSNQFNEYLYQNIAGGISEVTFDPAGNTITIDVTASGNVVPPVRPGDWLLDASYIPTFGGQPVDPTKVTNANATVNGFFYRVVGVTQNSDTSFTFEVQQPLRNMTATMAVNPATGSTYAAQKVIFLEGVAEVFEKGPGWMP